MARRKKPDDPPTESNGTTETPTETNGNGHDGNGSNGGEKRKPIASWRLMSDRTTSVELAVWSNTFKNQQTGEEYEQLSITLQRSYKDQNEQWCKGGSWRVHDVPILSFLIQKAHAFALDRRMEIPF